MDTFAILAAPMVGAAVLAYAFVWVWVWAKRVLS